MRDDPGLSPVPGRISGYALREGKNGRMAIQDSGEDASHADATHQEGEREWK